MTNIENGNKQGIPDADHKGNTRPYPAEEEAKQNRGHPKPGQQSQQGEQNPGQRQNGDAARQR